MFSSTATGHLSRHKPLVCRRVLAVRAVWQHAPVDAERLEPLHLLRLRREPSEGRPLDDVIEREQPAHEHLRGRLLAPAVADIRDAKRPVDRFLCDVDGTRAAGKDGPRVLNGELLLEQRANEAAGGFSVRTRLEVRPYWDRVKTPLWRQTRAIHSASRPVQPRAASAASWLARSWTGGRVTGRVTRAPAPDRGARRGGGFPWVDDHPLGVRGRQPRAGAGAGPAVAPWARG